MESRILLSGNSIDATEAPDSDAIATALVAESDSRDQIRDSAQAAGTAQATDPIELSDVAGPTEVPAQTAFHLEVVFIDSFVADSAQLISDLQDPNLSESQRLIFQLNPGENVFDQIPNALEPLSGVGAIHILSMATMATSSSVLQN